MKRDTQLPHPRANPVCAWPLVGQPMPPPVSRPTLQALEGLGLGWWCLRQGIGKSHLAALLPMR